MQTTTIWSGNIFSAFSVFAPYSANPCSRLLRRIYSHQTAFVVCCCVLVPCHHVWCNSALVIWRLPSLIMIIFGFQWPLVPSLAALLCSQKMLWKRSRRWMDGLGWCWCRWMEVVYGHRAHEVQGALTSSISCISFGGMPQYLIPMFGWWCWHTYWGSSLVCFLVDSILSSC